MQLHVVFAGLLWREILLSQLLNEVLSNLKLVTVTHDEINMGVTPLKFRQLYRETQSSRRLYD